jgi:predicted PurR-regulated permease PerM
LGLQLGVGLGYNPAMAQKLSGRFPPPWDSFIPLLTRLLVWGLLFGTLVLLRSFLLLIFLTFVFAYIQSHTVDRLARRIPGRKTRVWLVAMGILAILVAIGAFVVPRVRDEAQLFANQYTKYIYALDKEIVALSRSYPLIEKVSPSVVQLQGNETPWSMQLSPTAHLFQTIAGLGEGLEGTAEIRDLVISITSLGEKLLGIGSAFFLSLLFSFLIVLDLPHLTQSVKGLKNTSLRFIYDEVAEDIHQFGSVLGRALECQLAIATLNTVLTVIGIYLMGLGSKMAFLALIVFLCSFVPVAGVFISSIPICLLALQAGGVHFMLLAIALIVGIHMIETYILNPRIYGHHMHMNPVLVLCILTIGGKLFGIWGLVLGVPVCTYFFGHYIRRRA